ncbi:glycosyltransferase family 39 protein [Flavobacterium zepuense]|uniref:Glycosyltransferase family 39 protein n=1 Tax=Flavobacterium zepuense TaxID=2593302 RepID=A0A552UXP5_9FLAO|nr:glycosyltransferase family 39 protein [Flavobacterium zepuense]TRW22972.1 glycosyltransferase family 39 protein [Flavobacterium zepuense]
MINRLHAFMLQKPITAIVLFGIITRLFVMLLYGHVTIFKDSEGYQLLGKRLANFNLMGYDGTRSPGYPLLLTLAGNYLPLAIVYQMLLGLVTAVYLYKTLCLIHVNKKAALYLTLLLNSFIHVIFYEAAILTESVTLLFMTLSFYYTFKLLYSTFKFKDILVFGLILGWFILIKPFYIFLPFLIYGIYTIKDFTFSRIINKVLLITVFPLISFLGWSYVNKVNTGYFVSTTYFGINIAQNCVYFAEKTSPEYAEIGALYAKLREARLNTGKDMAMTIWLLVPEMMETTGVSLPDLSNRLSKYSKVTIAKNPVDYAKQVVTLSWKDFWQTVIYWNYSEFYFPYVNKAFALIWIIQRYILLVFKITFIALIPYYCYRFIVNRKITPMLVIVVVVFTASLLQAMATYGTNSRFSYPFELLMIITVLLTFKKPIKQAVAAIF